MNVLKYFASQNNEFYGCVTKGRLYHGIKLYNKLVSSLNQFHVYVKYYTNLVCSA